MSFLHPEFLYYMLPPLFILFALLLTQKEAQANFFSQEVMERLRVSANTLTLKARNALFMLIGVLLIIALAGPVIKEGKIEIKAKSADIMIAMDISDSMLAEDVYPNRLRLAKQKALEFLRLAPNERIGVIAFAKNSYLVSPLSFDHDAVAFLLKNLDTSSITEQGTDFLSMLEVVDRSIKNESRRYILLLSDGGDAKDFSREIAYAKEHNITVFVLAIGTKKGAPIKLPNGEFIKQNGSIIITKLNENIAELATKTGGVYIEGVNSNKDVKTMLREIEAKAKKKEMKSEEIEKYIPLFYYPVGLALLLLLIATSSMSKREKVNVPALFLLALVLFNAPAAKAGVLDFLELKDAQEAYKQQNYKKSAHYFDAYAKKSNKGAAYYNAGNALYKQKRYKEALKNYEKATFADKSDRAKNFANMGNAHAKLGSEEELKAAIKSYEESLKLQEDKEVRENLEAVKKALEKKQQKKQQQQNKNQKNKDQKNKQQQNKEQQQNQQNKQNKEQQNKKEQQKQNQQQQEKNDQKQQTKDQEQNKENKQERKSKQQSEEEKKNQEQKNKEEKKQEQQKEQQNKEQKKQKEQQKLQELKANEKKQKDKEKKGAKAAQIKQKDMKDKMSDAEEKKWLKALNSQQNSYLYMLNKEKPMKENPNEKPW
ncbi:MAG TPA: VWA domain-containing protein [Sulfurimonas autotrophica]|uniref:VWA domain-containing protein n=1 Tax=Sulfurimonas autotrophica TaxID=202747 RepID=A0A7C3C4C2_9BACT|nr:VWA domain-containing protein [Sulfurimonas autotrophica]